MFEDVVVVFEGRAGGLFSATTRVGVGQSQQAEEAVQGFEYKV